MLYLLFFSVSISIVYFSERFHFNESAKNAFLIFSALFLCFLPALQFNVGTDYFSYYGMTRDPAQTDIIFNKGEYFFYFFVEFLSAFGFHGQWIFLFHSILSSLLLVNILRKLRGQGYFQWIALLLIVVVTGLIHNQMNGLRSMLAVYLFINAFIYKACGQFAKSILFSIIGIFSHQTFLVMALFILLPSQLYLHVYSYIRVYYFSLFIFFGSGSFLFFIDSFVEHFMPFYLHYLNLSFFESGVDFLNVLTKMYYVGGHLLFLVFVGKMSKDFSRFDKIVLGFWALGANLYLGMMFVSGLFRAFHYVVFFGMFPIYFMLRFFRFDSFAVLAIFSYLVVPYLLKVLVFRVGEYDYEFFFL